MNKKYLFIGLALAVASSFTACEEESDAVREISPEFTGAASVYFPSTKATLELDPTLGITSTKVVIARSEDKGEVTVPITVTKNDENIFKVPAQAVFKDGATTDTLLIDFPGATEGVTYNLELSVDASCVNPYLSQVSTFTMSMAQLKWTRSEEQAVFHDVFWSDWFGLSETDLAFYVDYEYVKVGNTMKYRFLNPYNRLPDDALEPDRYGVYDAFVYSHPDVGLVATLDEEDRNMFIDVTGEEANLIGTYKLGTSHPSYGDIYVQQTAPGAYYASDEDGFETIVFSADDQTLVNNLAGYNDKWYYLGGDFVIYLKASQYQEANSVLHIADLEDAYNNPDIEWNEVEGTKFTEFVSEAFDKSWENQTLVAAEDMDPNAGDQSEFLNLYALTDLYAEGYNFAFYMDTIKNKITIPTQPTGLTFAGKEIYVRDAGESVVEYGVEHYTIPCTQYTFNVELITKDENLIGNYTEIYYSSIESKPAPEITKDFFLGNFVMTGKSQFNGEPDANAPVAIYEDEEGNVIIEGVTYSPIIASYNDEAKTLSFAPQQLADYGPYDLTLYTTTLDGEIGETDADAVVLSVADPFSGVLAVDETSTCNGFLVSSDAAGGWVDGYWGLEFTPAPAAAAPAVKSAVKSHKFQAVKHEVAKVSTANLKIQGKASRYAFKSHAHAKAIAF